MAIATGDVILLTGKYKGRQAYVLPITDGDDALDADGAAVAREAAEDTLGTFSAWVNIDNITTDNTLVCFADKSAEEYIALDIQSGLVTGRCVDGTVDQWTTQADAVHITPHKWHHIAMVQPADGGGVRLYVDGVRIAATNDVTTDVDQWIGAELSGLDSCRIACGNIVGDDTYTQELAGAISDVKYWNRALTAKDIVRDYKGLAQHLTKDGLAGAADTSDATYLQNHWKMEDLTDDGSGNDPLVIQSAVYQDPNYSQITSLCRHYSLVVADVGTSMSVHGESATVLIPKA